MKNLEIILELKNKFHPIKMMQGMFHWVNQSLLTALNKKLL